MKLTKNFTLFELTSKHVTQLHVTNYNDTTNIEKSALAEIINYIENK